MENTTLNRKELYNLVWSEPLLALSKKYRISDNGLRKICHKMNIPLPQMGHWQKINYSKKVRRKKLPVDYSGENEITLTIRGENDDGTYSDLSPLDILIKEIKDNPDLPHIVPPKLSRPDKLIIEARESLKKKKTDLWSPLIVTGYGNLTIKVAPKNVPRALRIIDTFIKLVRARGHQFKVDYDSRVIIEDVDTPISLREKLKNIKATDDRSDYKCVTTGIFVFKIMGWGDREWEDRKNKKIEDQLPRILATIELKTSELKEIWRQNDLRRQKEEELRRIEKEKQERKEKELNDFKKLLNEAKRWQNAKILRQYINVLEDSAQYNDYLSDEFMTWIKWAKDKVDWYDPLVDKSDFLLDEFDKQNI